MISEAERKYYECVDIHKVVRLQYGTKKGCFFGVGALDKIDEILDDLKPSYVGFVTTPSAYKKCGAWDKVTAALAKRGIEYLHYDKVRVNPTTTGSDEATKLFRPKYDENFLVIGIGGGSAEDTAKVCAVLLEHSDKTAAELYHFKFEPERRAHLVLINTTAGTGSEADRFAVNSILEEDPPVKPGLGYPPMYCDYSINDPSVLVTLSPFFTRYTSVDALNHAMETITALTATPWCRTLAADAIRIIAYWLPKALEVPDDLRARYWLHYAACIAGMAFDEGLLHITHVLEHTMSAHVPTLCHGCGLALIQPGVLRAIWPKCYDELVYTMKPILGEMEGKPEEAEEAARRLRSWLESVGMTETMETFGFKKTDIPKLIADTHACPGMDGQLTGSPVPATDEVLASVYASGFVGGLD